jgi:hemin uptake protein HemP
MSLNTIHADADEHAAFRHTGALSAPMRPRLASTELLRGARELIIQHGEHEYRLRLTQNDKLILTK